ncbi:unnamed protein product [Schistosoma margrebowiei]|uniref:Uncharacterized protein n=1 Tax=Schistosoma margrebowiei TaxID=48269 RepID=A0A183M7M2_9TREM|nr:unnamed protein product [Schistosoma margrebowiei]
MNSGDKSLDPRGLSTLDKNVTDLVNSEDSQHDCTDEHLFSTECHQDNPTEVDHRHSNGDADNNEIAMNSGDKSLDPRGLSTLDKNVTDLVNSEDSQHDCTDEHLFSTECHQDNPTEIDKKISSPLICHHQNVDNCVTENEVQIPVSSPTIIQSCHECSDCHKSFRFRKSLQWHKCNHKVRDFHKNSSPSQLFYCYDLLLQAEK